MNKLKIALIGLFVASSLSAQTSMNIGVGAVASKTSLTIEDKNKTSFDFENSGTKTHFAGRVNVHAFYNMFGLRVSVDAGSDKKKIGAFISKSNFTARVAPAVQYNVDKFNVCASIGGVYKNVEIKHIHTVADKKHHFGIGWHVGVSYAINNKISAFVEANADFLLKKDNKFGPDNFKAKSNLDFAGCVGVSAQLIG